MIGNEEYGRYVPNGVNPISLSREFLLSVSNIIIKELANFARGSSFV